jgi:sulfoxide reductase catalytic subunit YedY
MLIRKPSDIRSSEITDQALYVNRRQILSAGLGAVAGLALARTARAAALTGYRKNAVTLNDTPTSFKDITTYNNFYEFGTSKSDPSRYAPKYFKPILPWTVTVDGECAKPGTIGYEEIASPALMEERIYRHRCVEAWSMVIPWIGVPLATILKRFEPTSKAKFVRFTTLLDPKRMPGQNTSILKWPYQEGLRIDEAMHPLALLAVGLYGQTLLPQNGAPLRLVVPWKYGFKSIKSIVRISFVETQPPTTWDTEDPQEYAFYSNVNPNVSNTRWSQATERPIGHFFRRKTEMFNGYGDQVAHLYTGMDLRKYF